MRNPLFILLPALLVAACAQEPAAPDENGQINQISHVISDGSHSAGNPDFFFLPPLVGSPTSSPNFDAGKFNGRLHPWMAVYPLPAGSACTGTPKDGPRAVAVSPQEEMYKLDWDTRAANLDANTTYRLCVMSSASGGTLLGFIDLLPVTGGVKNARTGEVFTFNDGRTVPVKFRIETGALSYDPAHPGMVGTEFTVDSAGGTVTLKDDAGPSRFAAVSVPAGAVPAGQEVTIVLAQEDPKYPTSEPSKCLPGDLTQSDGCYQIRTEPALFAFNTPVRVEICVDASPVPEGLWPDLLVHKYNTTQGLQALPWAEPTLIGSDCSGPIGFGASSAAFGLFARWVGNLVAPSELSASLLAAITVPKGIGGTTGSFSDFGGAVPSTAPQAPVGLTVPASATVGQAGLVATASGGSGTGAFSFTSHTPSVCSVDSASITTGSITTLAAGTCSLTATKAADAIYAAATSDTSSFTVMLSPQALVTLTVPDSAAVGEAGLVATASGGSGTGSFSITSLTPSVCWLRGDSIFTLAMGTCSLTATKAADAIYMAAISDTNSFNVMVNFENLPNGTPAPDLTCLTDQFEGSGIIVSFAPSTTPPFPVANACARLINAGSTYYEAGVGRNMAISSMTNGTFALQFTTPPDTVTFQLVTNATAPAPVVTAANPAGAMVTPWVIRSATYTSVNGVALIRYVLEVTMPGGVAGLTVREWPYMYILDNVMVTSP